MRFPRLAKAVHRVLMSRVANRRRPDFVIGADDPQGAYLLRWFLVPRNRFFNIYLHHFLRDDDDRALHDHPWPSCSWILATGYIEHTIAAGGIHRRRRIDPGTVRFMRPTHAHRVELLPAWWAEDDYDTACEVWGDDPKKRATAWTLFITGPRLRRWGFHCPQEGWIDFALFTRPGSTGETGAGCDA